MELFYASVGSQTININGQRVKFNNCIAEVEEEFGAEVLKLGLPGLYEMVNNPPFKLLVK